MRVTIHSLQPPSRSRGRKHYRGSITRSSTAMSSYGTYANSITQDEAPHRTRHINPLTRLPFYSAPCSNSGTSLAIIEAAV